MTFDQQTLLVDQLCRRKRVRTLLRDRDGSRRNFIRYIVRVASANREAGLEGDELYEATYATVSGNQTFGYGSLVTFLLFSMIWKLIESYFFANPVVLPIYAYLPPGCGEGSVAGCVPSAIAYETAWSNWIALQMDYSSSSAEHAIYSNRRVDVLIPSLAIEVEWCDRHKIAEAVEQATAYGIATGRPAAIVLLVGRRAKSEERLIYNEFVAAAARGRVVAVSWLDVHEPDIDQMKRHLGLTA